MRSTQRTARQTWEVLLMITAQASFHSSNRDAEFVDFGLVDSIGRAGRSSPERSAR
jgi:hypothetical protein